MDPIRVLQIISLERSNYFLENLVDYCDRRSVAFTIVTLSKEGTFATELRKRNVPVYSLGCTKRSMYPKAVHLVRGLIRKHNVDIVHTHLVEPTWVGLTAAKLTGRAVVITRHHSDAVYRVKNPLKRWAHLTIERCCRAAADHIIAPAVGVRRCLLEREGTDPSRITLIPYGQDARRFDAVTDTAAARVRHELGMEGTPAVACISRLVPQKGHVYLFEALSLLKKEFPHVSLYLAGDGPHRRELEDAARTLGVAGRVRFLGWRDDALEIMAAADVVAHPSLTEALSSTLIEALMLAKPIVATDVSGVRDTLDGYGTIIPAASYTAMADALRSTFMNLERAKQLAAGGRARILEKMSASTAAEAHVGVYEAVMGRR